MARSLNDFISIQLSSSASPARAIFGPRNCREENRPGLAASRRSNTRPEKAVDMIDSHPPPVPIAPTRFPAWIEQRGLLLIAVAIAWFYLWTATSGPEHFSLKQEPGELDYYNLQVDGFLSGHLNLKYQGDPGLATLKDPYDPAQNAPYRVLDMSYYKGKYYIYFGPTPALVLLLPWKLITGEHLPSHIATVIFTTAGYWISLLILLRLRRRCFPDVGVGPVWLTALIMGLASMAPALLRRPAVYELAISCGYFFVMLAFWALYHAITAERRRLAWLALASTAYGLAILARPTCIYGAVIFPLVVGSRAWWRERPQRWISADGLRLLAAAALPLGFIFLGMLLYNYLRFDNPLEFGQIYQLTGRDMSKVRAFSWSYLPFNAWLYLLMPAQHSAYFPFFLNGRPPAMPIGYDGLDDLYGMLPNLPVVVLAGGLLLRARGMWIAREVKFFGAVLVTWFAAVFGVFLFFSGATLRYYLDFMPAWLLLSCLGMWSVGRWVAPRRWLNVTAWTVMTLLALSSILFALMVSFQHAGLLRKFNAPAFNRLARISNHVSFAYDRLAGTKYGPLKVELKFPRDQRGRFEPLLVRGAFPAVDYLWVLYLDDAHVQIGYEHTNYGGSVTQPIAIDYSRPHTLEVDAGFLYPPEMHPFFSGRAAEARERVHTLAVRLDGAPYLDTHADFYDPVSPSLLFGRNDITDTFGRRFTGEIGRIERLAPQVLLDSAPRAGPVVMSLIFPAKHVEAREPLIVTGETGRGDIFYVEYLDESHVRFALDHWGVGLVKSEPVEFAPDRIQVLEVSMGSLELETAEPAKKNRFIVRFNGRTLIDCETKFHRASLTTQTIGVNLIGGSTCGPAFTGKILSIKRPNP
jgi:hypothetical protein